MHSTAGGILDYSFFVSQNTFVEVSHSYCVR